MILSLLLAILLNFFVIISCEKCRTNNDCDSGRCEWRRCVGKLGRVISGRMEIENCYVDDDCPAKQVCRGGSCQERLPLVNDLAKLRPACKREPPEFCAEVTGFENAQCREIEFEYEKIRSYVCQLPPPFIRTELKFLWLDFILEKEGIYLQLLRRH
ncbi:hypothetical protein WUBG_08612 [Wuchereria bancrofti]|uniref:EB domain-containing protein n=1 Tax=Wuchereria bancrofti TaxID=6293 RepID=J9EZB0_WUCBA|nr:hypothetical protein WUBG_08612 [Wuchereria bancrofti]